MTEDDLENRVSRYSTTRIVKHAAYALSGLLLGLSAYTHRGLDNSACHPSKTYDPQISAATVSAEPMKGYDLAGRPLTRHYVGIDGVVPDSLHFDDHNPNRSLGDLWAEKIRRSDGRPAVVDARDNYAASYSYAARDTMGFEDYVYEASQSINTVRENLSSDRLREALRLESYDEDLAVDGQSLTSELETTQYITERIDGSDLVAYAMTEIGESHDAGFNKDTFDFILSHYGRGYLERIPSLNDDLVSVGPYQFTPQVLQDSAGSKGAVAKMNQAVTDPDLRVPPSPTALSGNDHHRAAYLFAVSNVARLVRNTDHDHHKSLINAVDDGREDIITYLAIAHNSPQDALSIGKAWLNDGASQDIRAYSYGKRAHADRTHANLQAF